MIQALLKIGRPVQKSQPSAPLWISTLRRRIESLSTEHGISADEQTIERMMRILEATIVKDTPAPHASLTDSGGITLKWRQGPETLLLRIPSAAGCRLYAISEEGAQMIEWTFVDHDKRLLGICMRTLAEKAKAAG